jgi:hypothetical protein
LLKGNHFELLKKNFTSLVQADQKTQMWYYGQHFILPKFIANSHLHGVLPGWVRVYRKNGLSGCRKASRSTCQYQVIINTCLKQPWRSK